MKITSVRLETNKFAMLLNFLVLDTKFSRSCGSCGCMVR